MSNDNINLSIVNFFEQNKDGAGIPYIKNKDWVIVFNGEIYNYKNNSIAFLTSLPLNKEGN